MKTRTFVPVVAMAATLPALAGQHPGYPLWVVDVLRAEYAECADDLDERCRLAIEGDTITVSWDAALGPVPSVAALAETAMPIFRGECAEIIAGRHVAARDAVASPIVREDCRYDPPIPDAATCSSIATDLRALGAARGSADAALATAAAAADLDAVRGCPWEVAP
jgi:hypothetical protein